MATQTKALHILNNHELLKQDFDSALRDQGFGPLRRSEVTTLQINMGKVCNQACHHCHVEAGPSGPRVCHPKSQIASSIC